MCWCFVITFCVFHVHVHVLLLAFSSCQDDGPLMEICVQMPDGETLTLVVKDTSTIGTVKTIIDNKKGIPMKLQRIILGYKYLETRRNLLFYNITGKSKLTLVPSLDLCSNMC